LKKVKTKIDEQLIIGLLLMMIIMVKVEIMDRKISGKRLILIKAKVD